MAPASPCLPSLLLATRTTGLLARRAKSAKARSFGVRPARASITNIRGSARAVAGDAGFVVHERELLTDQPVEQRRFADIGPADDSNREGRHRRSLRLARLFSAKIMQLASQSTYADCINLSAIKI